MSQSCFAYIKMLEKLISSSKTAREEFYNFLKEGREEEEPTANDKLNTMDDEEAHDEVFDGVGLGGPSKKNKQKFTARSDRERMIGMLMRVQHDLLLFLSTSPT